MIAFRPMPGDPEEAGGRSDGRGGADGHDAVGAIDFGLSRGHYLRHYRLSEHDGIELYGFPAVFAGIWREEWHEVVEIGAFGAADAA